MIALTNAEVGGGEASPDFKRRDTRRIGLKRQGNQIVDRRQIARQSLVLRLLEVSLRLGNTLPVAIQIELAFDIAH